MRGAPPGRHVINVTQRGVAATELVLVLPLLILILFGLVDLTHYISMQRKIAYATTLVTDLVTRSDATVNARDVEDYFKAVGILLNGEKNLNNLGMAVYNYGAAGGRIAPKWTHTTAKYTCPAPDTTSLATIMNGNDVIVTVICADYTPIIPQFLNMSIIGFSSIQIREQFAMRPRQGQTLSYCSTC